MSSPARKTPSGLALERAAAQRVWHPLQVGAGVADRVLAETRRPARDRASDRSCRPWRSASTSSGNHAARSTSGNVCRLPERGGHSISNVLLWIAPGSQSASSAKACTTLPPGCRIGASGVYSSATFRPVSSSNSRLAASSGSSSGSNSPLGIDHAAPSLFAQNGPPGWTRKTSSAPPWRAVDQQARAHPSHGSPSPVRGAPLSQLAPLAGLIAALEDFQAASDVDPVLTEPVVAAITRQRKAALRSCEACSSQAPAPSALPGMLERSKVGLPQPAYGESRVERAA